MPRFTSSISYFQQPVRWARVVVPEVAAVTVAVFTHFEAGKRVFLKKLYIMDQYEEFKKHYIAAKVEYLKACARYDSFKKQHSIELDEDNVDIVIKLNNLYLAIHRRSAEVIHIFKHMAKFVGDFDSIIEKDLRIPGKPNMHVSALADVSLSCDETGFTCLIFIYIMRPRSFYAKLLKDTVKKTSCLYFLLYRYVNHKDCDDAIELIDKLGTLNKKGICLDSITECVSDNDILNSDRGFLNRYIDDTIRRYCIEEYDKKHK